MKPIDSVELPHVAHWNPARQSAGFRPGPGDATWIATDAGGAAMSRTDTLPILPAIRSDRTGLLVVLIEVPEAKTHRSERFRAAVSARGTRRPPRTGQPRRRIRRQVRLAGCALLTLAPLVSLCTLGWSSSHPSRILACSIADASEPATFPQKFANPRDQSLPDGFQTGPPLRSPGAVAISIEPAAVAPGTDPVIPVIFPGYVLPDDGLEDRAHEGS